MEEKSKEVKMEAIKTNQEKKELSYDELKELAQKVFDENRYLKNELYKANQTLGIFSRLDYLLRIVEIANNAKDWKFNDGFVQMCIDDIEVAMAPPAKKEVENTNIEEN